MVWKIAIACLLVAATVAVHALGLARLLTLLIKARALPPVRLWPITWLLIRITWALLLIHAAEITVWGLFYFCASCLPTFSSAVYFSGVTYATIGYGDLLLPQSWRMLAPIEGLTGILMCGLSAGLFFAVVNRLFGTRFEAKTS
jgi:hypothetical protein